MRSTAVEMTDWGLGPLERKHLQYANYCAVAGGAEITRTHWHIALANGLGWAFDGMDSSLFGLASPLIITEFTLDVPTYRSGLQIALLVGIVGLYFWPWLSDRYGRRTLLAINIALFSLLMPVVALAPTFAVFVAGRSVVNFALNGEWSLVGCRTTCRPKSTGRRRNIALFMCVGASSASSACGWRAGWPTGSAEGSASSRC